MRLGYFLFLQSFWISLISETTFLKWTLSDEYASCNMYLNECNVYANILRHRELVKVLAHQVRPYSTALTWHSDGLVLCHLPDGPTAHFKISNVRLRKEMKASWSISIIIFIIKWDFCNRVLVYMHLIEIKKSENLYCRFVNFAIRPQLMLECFHD